MNAPFYLKIKDSSGASIYNEDLSSSKAPNYLTKGTHIWKWDGYDNSGILDTGKLKQGKRKIVLKTICEGAVREWERDVACEAKKEDWVDVMVDKNKKTVEMLWRLDLRPSGSTPASYALLALDGIKKHWSRNQPFNLQFLSGGPVKYTVETAAVNEPKPKMSEKFDIIYNSMKKEDDWKRSYSITFFPVVAERCIYYNDRTAYLPKNKPSDDIEYLHTSGHEVGHITLKHAYGRIFSWEHQGTSTLPQANLKDSPVLPANTSNTEIELMWYYQDRALQTQKFDTDGIASKIDIRGAIWLATLSFS